LGISLAYSLSGNPRLLKLRIAWVERKAAKEMTEFFVAFKTNRYTEKMDI
jgi:hypothetical protein